MASTVKVNTITTQSGSTLTVGESGKTISLASGATATGFGRTGAVDWQTTKKTGDFTAATTEGYFVDTSSAAITATLPSSPSAGAIVGFKDYTGTFATYNLTIARNGSNIQGNANDSKIITNRASVIMVYVDSTEGWVFTVESNVADLQDKEYVTASGGTITTSGDYKIHTFTGAGTFTVSAAGNAAGSNTVDYMVVAGGGGGGGSTSPGGGGGGGGGGGWRASSGTASGSYTAGPGPLTSPVSALSVSAQGYPITIGAGGTGAVGAGPGPSPVVATQGGSSVFSTITSAGGGLGGHPNSPAQAGGNGGSGGGSSWETRTGGTGNTPPVSPPQGNDGGNGTSAPTYQGGPGGGAVGAGTDLPAPSGNQGQSGGVGAVSHITGSPVGYAGGGGGGGTNSPGNGDQGGGASPDGSGGAGGPATPSAGPGRYGSDGATNRGGGAGGGASGPAPDNSNGGVGGSGVVVIRYKYQN
jgi:hypothetical protein|tara:strand:- start:48 stop:1460 length:1413 start_codon:yes stop_codon:yes gene_type:complete